jgi:hypothetical protein
MPAWREKKSGVVQKDYHSLVRLEKSVTEQTPLRQGKGEEDCRRGMVLWGHVVFAMRKLSLHLYLGGS